MTNQNNPFYGNYYLNGSAQIPANQPNPFFNQPNRFQSIPGRTVNNLDEITPQEVPMDGSVSLFPQQDYSAIYAKTWTKEGTIATMKFIPEQPQNAESQKSPLEMRLDSIDQRLEALDKKLNRPRNYQKKNYHPSKEVETNE